MTIPTLRPVRLLREMVPGVELAAMDNRGSPALGTEVLSVNGPLQPGHSGAPIFDDEGQIVDIANGGFVVGQYGVGWASLPTAMSLLDADEAAASLFSIAALVAAQGFATVHPETIAAAAIPERTSLLALSSPTMYRLWLTDNGNGVPTIGRSVADIEAETLTWVVTREGEHVLGRNARGETAYQYFRSDPGRYLIWLKAFHGGRYVPVSNYAYYVVEFGRHDLERRPH